MNTFKKGALATAMLVGLSFGAQASAVIGTTDLMTQDFHAQLEGLISSGSVDFTNIFDKQLGDDAFDWHAAVDLQGSTITLMEIISNVDDSKTIVGLYSETSWKSNNTYTGSTYNAFLVNLTTGQSFLPSGSYTGYGPYSVGDYGPTVGAGHDFHLSTNLTTGYANPGYAYGTVYDPYILTGTGGQNNWQVGAMETFSISEANIALDGTGYTNTGGATDVSTPLALSAFGMFGLAFARRNRKR